MKTHWQINAPGRDQVAACSWNITANLTTERKAVDCKTCKRFIPMLKASARRAAR